MSKTLSSTGGIRPVSIIDADTGEICDARCWDDLENLITFVQAQANKVLQDPLQVILIDKGRQELKAASREPKQSSVLMERLGYKLAYDALERSGDLPRDVKVKNRIGRLWRDSMGTALKSYLDNPNPKKQLPSAGLSINLGASDTQMRTLYHDTDNHMLILKFKCWKNVYYLEFEVPAYTNSYEIVKWCAPTVYKKNDDYVFSFAYEEQAENRKFKKKERLDSGIDYGDVLPYHAGIVNHKGERVADFKASGRLCLINDKRRRLDKEVKNLSIKKEQHERLGNFVRAEILDNELKHTRNKRTSLRRTVAREGGAEIARRLEKFKVETVNVEYLKWAHGKKYGSRWNHNVQQEYMEHSLKKKGVRMKRVDPRNSSQRCWKCESPIKHNKSKRTVWCAKCKREFDRDMSASLHHARDVNEIRRKRLESLRKYFAPNITMRSIGVSCSSLTMMISDQANGFSKTSSKVQVDLNDP